MLDACTFLISSSARTTTEPGTLRIGSFPCAPSVGSNIRIRSPARGAEGQRSRGQARLTEGNLSAETGACSSYPQVEIGKAALTFLRRLLTPVSALIKAGDHDRAHVMFFIRNASRLPWRRGSVVSP